MGMDAKGFRVLLWRMIKFSMNSCFRFALKYPIVSGALLTLLVLYLFLPSVFYLLVYSFPVLACTAVFIRFYWRTRRTQSGKDEKKDDRIQSVQSKSVSVSKDGDSSVQSQTLCPGTVEEKTEDSSSQETKMVFSKTPDNNSSSIGTAGVVAEINSLNPVEGSSRNVSFVGNMAATLNGASSGPDVKSIDDSDKHATKSRVGISEAELESSDSEEAPDEAKKPVEWTEDDQKNLMDLGFSEIERNKRLESLIARRRARKLFKMNTEKCLIDMNVAPPPIAHLLVARSNPFEFPNICYEQMPGSAPSVLLPNRNPFDLPYDPLEEKPDLMTDSFQQEFMTAPPKETLFCRHESFCKGAPIYAPQGLHEHAAHSIFKRPSDKGDDGQQVQNSSQVGGTLRRNLSATDLVTEEKDIKDQPGPNNEAGSSKVDKSTQKDENGRDMESSIGNGTETVLKRDQSESPNSSSEDEESNFRANRPKLLIHQNLRPTGFKFPELPSPGQNSCPLPKARALNELSYDSGSSVIDSARSRDYSFYPNRGNWHTPNNSIASDMQVEVSEVGSPPLTADGTASSDDGDSLTYDGDVEKDVSSGSDDMCGLSPHAPGVEELETALRAANKAIHDDMKRRLAGNRKESQGAKASPVQSLPSPTSMLRRKDRARSASSDRLILSDSCQVNDKEETRPSSDHVDATSTEVSQRNMKLAEDSTPIIPPEVKIEKPQEQLNHSEKSASKMDISQSADDSADACNNDKRLKEGNGGSKNAAVDNVSKPAGESNSESSNYIERKLTGALENSVKEVIERKSTGIHENPDKETIESKSTSATDNPAKEGKKSTGSPGNSSEEAIERKSTGIHENSAKEAIERKSISAPENPAREAIEKKSSSNPGNSSEEAIERKSTGAPENPSEQVIERKSTDVPENPTEKAIESKSTGNPENPAEKTIESKSTVIPENPAKQVSINYKVDDPVVHIDDHKAKSACIPENPAKEVSIDYKVNDPVVHIDDHKAKSACIPDNPAKEVNINYKVDDPVVHIDDHKADLKRTADNEGKSENPTGNVAIQNISKSVQGQEHEGTTSTSGSLERQKASEAGLSITIPTTNHPTTPNIQQESVDEQANASSSSSSSPKSVLPDGKPVDLGLLSDFNQQILNDSSGSGMDGNMVRNEQPEANVAHKSVLTESQCGGQEAKASMISPSIDGNSGTSTETSNTQEKTTKSSENVLNDKESEDPKPTRDLHCEPETLIRTEAAAEFSEPVKEINNRTVGQSEGTEPVRHSEHGASLDQSKPEEEPSLKFADLPIKEKESTDSRGEIYGAADTDRNNKSHPTVDEKANVDRLRSTDGKNIESQHSTGREAEKETVDSLRSIDGKHSESQHATGQEAEKANVDSLRSIDGKHGESQHSTGQEAEKANVDRLRSIDGKHGESQDCTGKEDEKANMDRLNSIDGKHGESQHSTGQEAEKAKTDRLRSIDGRNGESQYSIGQEAEKANMDRLRSIDGKHGESQHSTGHDDKKANEDRLKSIDGNNGESQHSTGQDNEKANIDRLSSIDGKHDKSQHSTGQDDEKANEDRLKSIDGKHGGSQHSTVQEDEKANTDRLRSVEEKNSESQHSTGEKNEKANTDRLRSIDRKNGELQHSTGQEDEGNVDELRSIDEKINESQHSTVKDDVMQTDTAQERSEPSGVSSTSEEDNNSSSKNRFEDFVNVIRHLQDHLIDVMSPTAAAASGSSEASKNFGFADEASKEFNPSKPEAVIDRIDVPNIDGGQKLQDPTVLDH